MWFTFKIAFAAFMALHFIKWRFTLWRTKRRRRNRVTVKPLSPGEAAQRMKPKPRTHNTILIANDNTPSPPKPDLVAVTPTTQQPPAQPRAQRNTKLINDVTSALINLGMTKRKAKQHVQQCYDNMNGKPSLNGLLTYSIKSLST